MSVDEGISGAMRLILQPGGAGAALGARPALEFAARVRDGLARLDAYVDLYRAIGGAWQLQWTRLGWKCALRWMDGIKKQQAWERIRRTMQFAISEIHDIALD
jgi:hypothetical protein